MRILVTGSAGLIGRSLTRALASYGIDPRGYDKVDGDDVRDSARLARAMKGCVGVVHLAAVSRPGWAEQDPEGCWATNVGGTDNVVQAAATQRARPFVLFASSREVYGEAKALPVREDAALWPLNVYGRSKVAGEELVRGLGPRGAIVRLSNVYGDPVDHLDRVVPAFVRAAQAGGELRVEGSERIFDFTNISDVTRALVCAVQRLAGDAELPTLHLVSGRATSLGALASMAIDAAGRGRKVEAPGRSWDVRRFCGDGGRAADVLGWTANVPIEEGVRELAAAIGAVG